MASVFVECLCQRLCSLAVFRTLLRGSHRDFVMVHMLASSILNFLLGKKGGEATTTSRSITGTNLLMFYHSQTHENHARGVCGASISSIAILEGKKDVTQSLCRPSWLGKVPSFEISPRVSIVLTK